MNPGKCRILSRGETVLSSSRILLALGVLLCPAIGAADPPVAAETQPAAETPAPATEAPPPTPELAPTPAPAPGPDPSLRDILGDELPKVELAPPQREAPTGIEEILVLGRERQQALQDLAVSVTIFTEAELRQRSIDSIDEIALATPNLQFAPVAGTSNEAAVYLRGIGQNDSIVTADPGVGIYVDGVYIGRAVGALFDLFDTERVEVIRGPQGSKLGKNTIGGAINVISRRPSGDLGITARVTIGEYDRLDGTISIEGPIIGETLSGRATLHTANRDGYVEVGQSYALVRLREADPENEFSIADTDDLNDKNSLAGRLTLSWVPTDSVVVDYSFDKTRDRPEAVGFDVLAADASVTMLAYSAGLAEVDPRGCLLLGQKDCQIAALNDPANINTQRYQQFYNPGDDSDPFGGQGFPKQVGLSGTPGCAPDNPYCVPIKPTADSRRICKAGSCYDRALGQPWDLVIDDDPLFASVDFDHNNELDLYGHSLSVQWDINESLSLRSVSGYRSFNSNRGLDVDGTAFDGHHSFVDTRQWQLSQELFVVGRAFDDRFQWQSGIFYFQEHAEGADRKDVLSTVSAAGREVICSLENDIRLSVSPGVRGTIEDDPCPRVRDPRDLESESKRAINVIRGLEKEDVEQVIAFQLPYLWLIETSFTTGPTFFFTRPGCDPDPNNRRYSCRSFKDITDQMYYFYPEGQFATYDGPHCSEEASKIRVKNGSIVSSGGKPLCKFGKIGADSYHGGFGFKTDIFKGNALGCPAPASIVHPDNLSKGTCGDVRARTAKVQCEVVSGTTCEDGFAASLEGAAERFIPLVNLPEETDSELENETDNYALTGYVQGSLEVTDKLTVEAALRLSYDLKKIFRNQKTLPSETLVIANATAEESWSDFLPSATLQYQLTPDIMGFVKASKGFKTGGFNGRGVDLSGEATPNIFEQARCDGGDLSACEAIAFADANADQLLEPYDPEELWSFEFGTRTQWFDNRLTFNLTGFYNVYSDIQLNTEGIDRNGNFTNRVDNAGKAVLQGLEMTLVALPFPGIFVDASVALNHGRYLEYDSGRNPECADLSIRACELRGLEYTIDGSDLKLPNFPGVDSAAGVTAIWPMPRLVGGGRMSLRGDVHYQSKLYLNALNTISVDPRALYNARLAWSNDDDWLSLAFFVRNLMDKEYLVAGLDLRAFGLQLGQYGAPRMWGLEAIISY